MSDIFHDVDEQLRRDRYTRSLRRFAPYIAAVVLAIVAGAGASQVWKSWKTGRANAAAQQYDKVLRQVEKGANDEAIKAFEALASDAPSGYDGLARLQEGALYLKKGDGAAAVASLDAAALNFHGQVLADFTRLKAAYAAFDTASYEALETRLKPLMKTGAPFSLLAQELLASKALATQHYEQAREAYQFLDRALDLPRGAKQRVREAKARIRRLEAKGVMAPQKISNTAGQPAPSDSSGQDISQQGTGQNTASVSEKNTQNSGQNAPEDAQNPEQDNRTTTSGNGLEETSK